MIRVECGTTSCHIILYGGATRLRVVEPDYRTLVDSLVLVVPCELLSVLKRF